MEIKKFDLTWNGTLRPITQKVVAIVQHHMAHATWSFEEVHDFHRGPRRGWHGIGYNYWIAYDGTIYEGRGEMIGAHAHAEWNPITKAVGYQGAFHLYDNMTDEQVRSGAWLNKRLLDKHGLTVDAIVGHKEVNATSCPGKYFRMQDIKDAITSGKVAEGDIMLKRGDRGESVYDYQRVLSKLGYDMGEWADMKTGDKNGLDGSFGGHTEKVTKEAQEFYGVIADGVVRADLYGKLALALAMQKADPEPEPDKGDFLVIVTTDVLNVRASPNSNPGTRVTTRVNRNDVFTIVGTDGDWGRLKSGMGWIYLPLTRKH